MFRYRYEDTRVLQIVAQAVPRTFCSILALLALKHYVPEKFDYIDELQLCPISPFQFLNMQHGYDLLWTLEKVVSTTASSPVFVCGNVREAVFQGDRGC